MTKTQFTIPGRIPSKKNSRRCFVKRGRMFNIPSKDYTQWEINAKFHLPDIYIETVRKISVVIYAPDKRSADLTNKIESIMDLMVKGQVIKDDNWFVVPKLSLVFGGVNKKEPRAEITIIS